MSGAAECVIELALLEALDTFKLEIDGLSSAQVRTSVDSALNKVSQALVVPKKAAGLKNESDSDRPQDISAISALRGKKLLLREGQALARDIEMLKRLDSSAFEEAAIAVGGLDVPLRVRQGLVDCNVLYNIGGKWLEHLKRVGNWKAVGALVHFLVKLPWNEKNARIHDSNKRLFDALKKLYEDTSLDGSLVRMLDELLSKAKWSHSRQKRIRAPSPTPVGSRLVYPKMADGKTTLALAKKNTLQMRMADLDKLHRRTRLSFADEKHKELRMVREIIHRHSDRWKWENNDDDTAKHAPDEVFDRDVTIEKQFFAKKHDTIRQMRRKVPAQSWAVGGDVPLCKGSGRLQADAGESEFDAEEGSIVEIPTHHHQTLIISAVPQEPAVQSKMGRGNFAKPKWLLLREILSGVLSSSEEQREFDNMWRSLDSVHVSSRDSIDTAAQR